MNGVIAELMQFFGISYVPTDFATFMFWLVSLIAGLYFVRVVLFTVFEFIKSMKEVTK